MEDKEPVLVGTKSGLSCYRVYNYFIPHRKEQYIQVFYDEWLQSQDGLKLNVAENKNYIVKDIKQGTTINNLDLPLMVIEMQGEIPVNIPNPALVPLSEDFNGFTNWFNYDAGSLPNGTTMGVIFETAIDQTLEGLPIGCKSGWIITQN